MPPYDMINKGWLKDILAGKKKLLKLRQVKLISVPKFDEVSVKNLYEKLLDLEGMSAYFPDKFAKGRSCDREYMFNIANSLHEDVVGTILIHAMN